MKVVLLSSTLLFLVGCNLTAQLLGGEREFTFTETYVLQGDEHALAVTFTVRDGIVSDMRLEPQATTPSERAEQLALSANAREHILLRPPRDIVLPASIGEASTELLTAFRRAVEKLRAT